MKKEEEGAGSAGASPEAKTPQKKGSGPWDLNVWTGLVASDTWTRDCLSLQGAVLKGDWIHWCHDFDGLPVDETCGEFEFCHCFPEHPRPKAPNPSSGEGPSPSTPDHTIDVTHPHPGEGRP